VSRGREGTLAGRLRVNGLEIYYERSGEGKPLVLLHGALSTIETSFARTRPALARRRHVIAIEQQGHGHTADTDRPFSYAQMADDTASLLQKLKVERADLFGYSLGAGIAIELAIRFPQLVGRIVLASPAYSRDGFRPGVLDVAETASPDALAGSVFHRAYLEVAPNPGDWPHLIEKCNELDRRFIGWQPKLLASIRAPALIIIGDADIVRPEHAFQMMELLQPRETGETEAARSQLAVLPGTTHLELVERDEWVSSMVLQFIE
jgi:pimeloyl-ACP methyl ester carboxylesterase